MRIAQPDWSQDVLGAWLLHCRNTDLEGRGVDMAVAQDAAEGKTRLNGLTAAQVAEVLDRVEAGIEIIYRTSLKPTYSVEAAACNLVHQPGVASTRAFAQALSRTASITATRDEQLTSAIYHMAATGQVAPVLKNDPDLQDVLEKHRLVPQVAAPAMDL